MRGERLGRRDSRETYRTKEWPGGENGSVYPVGAMMGEDPMLFPMGAPRHPLHQQVHPQLGGMREYEQDNKTKRAFPRGMPPAPPPDPVNITDLYSASGARADMLFELMDTDHSGSIERAEMERYYRKLNNRHQGF